MSTKVRLLNPKTGNTIELEGMTLYKCFLAFRYWPFPLFTMGRPIMGLTGVALIVTAIVFGLVIDDGEAIGVFAALVYISLGIYFVFNINTMRTRFYLENGWVNAPRIVDADRG